MDVLKLKSHFQKSLSDLYPSEEIQSFFNILAESYLNLSRLEIALNPQKNVSEEDLEKFEGAIFRLKKNEPIQYITGETEFFSLPLKVNEATLIPRPETEELVAWILNEKDNSEKNSAILDIGTGSGCIAISLAKNWKAATVSALDFSEKALKKASENAKLNEVEIDFLETDILAAQSLPKQYDIIVSNPPYVRELEKKMMSKNVLGFEPGFALFVKDENPLVFYQAISKLAKTHLKPNGKLFFEINEYLSEELSRMLNSEGFVNVVVKKDIFGKDRMIKCALNE